MVEFKDISDDVLMISKSAEDKDRLFFTIIEVENEASIYMRKDQCRTLGNLLLCFADTNVFPDDEEELLDRNLEDFRQNPNYISIVPVIFELCKEIKKLKRDK